MINVIRTVKILFIQIYSRSPESIGDRIAMKIVSLLGQELSRVRLVEIVYRVALKVAEKENF